MLANPAIGMGKAIFYLSLPRAYLIYGANIQNDNPGYEFVSLQNGVLQGLQGRQAITVYH